MFVDHIKIFAKAGDGGHGCSSFRREKFEPKGGPDGGDGGRGGDVILQVDHHTDNLKAFFYRPNQKAERGMHGQGQRKTGKSGKNLVLKVPPGTIVYRTEPHHLRKGKDDFEEPDLSNVDWAGEFIEDEEGQMVVMDRTMPEQEDETDDKDSAPSEEAEATEKAAEVLSEDEDNSEFFVDGEETGNFEVKAEEPHPYGELIADLTEIGQKFTQTLIFRL